MGFINKCICFDVSFETLLSESKTLSHDQLIQKFQCGTACGLCKPYIKEVLQTGKTSFPPKGV